MTTTINNEHNKLNVPNKREQNQTCLDSAERQGLRPKGNVPNLRFPEFQGEWEELGLSELLDFKNGLNPKPDKFGKGIKFISVMDILNNAVITYDCIKASVNVTEKELSDFSVEKGDMLFQRSSETLEDVGRANVYMDDKTAIFGGFVIRGKKKGEYDPRYFNYLLRSPFARKRIIPMGAGAQHFNIGQEGLSKVKLHFANIEEQKKIGKMLSLLDERIATQNKIIDKLQSLIKGIGKQLFMDNQNWRTVKIGELLRIGNGKDYKHLSIGKIPVYGTGGQMLLVNDYLYDGESVCIGRKGTIDTPMFLKGKFWTVDTLFYTYDFKDVLPKFCYYLFLQINWKLYNEGTGVPSLSKSTIENIKVKIPSLEQQQKICSILDCYEHKTNNEEQILELYHSEKQYLLRQMFI